MDPRSLHAFLRFGVFIGLCGLGLAVLQPRNSAEYVVSMCSAMIGGTMILLAVVAIRLTR